MTMTTVSPPASSSSAAAAESSVHRKAKLVALLKECVVHLERRDSPPHTPLFHQALYALHEHAHLGIASLEREITVLQQQKQKIIKDVEDMKKCSVADSDQNRSTTKKEPSIAATGAKATTSANDKLLELERVKKAQAEKRRQEVLEQRRKAAEEQKKKEQEEKRKFLEYEARKQQFKWHPSAAASSVATSATTKAESTTPTATKPKATASSDDAGQTKVRQIDHSLQSRMKDEVSAAFFDKDSNLNQKPAPQQHQQQHSQYQSTLKQQQPSPTPQQTTSNIDTQKGQRTQIPAQHSQQQSSNYSPRTFASTSPRPNTPVSASTGFQTPIQHSARQPQQGHTADTISSSSGHNSTSASWQSTQQQQPAGQFPPNSMNIPHLPKQTPPHPMQQHPHQAHASTTASSQQNRQHHPPTGSDRKYSQMSEHQRKPPQSNKSNDANEDKGSGTTPKTSASASPSSPPPSTTELKRSILLHWALQPPEYQILKPIPILVCTIQSVFPPAFGLNYHKYFDGWKQVTSADLLSASSSTTAVANIGLGGEWDSDKIKKVVRKLRFFLHPDKLPRDLSEGQIFCCQLLWDVTNDAYEDYKTSLEALDWVNN